MQTFQKNSLLLVGAVFLLAWFIAMTKISLDYAVTGWSGGDWLINYSGGFIRRGLLGEALKGTATILKVSPLVCVAFVKIVCCFVLFAYLMRRLISGKIRWVELLFLASPWALMFYLNDPAGATRKELLLLAFYCFFLWFEERNEHNLATSIILCFCLPVLVLIHEGLYFFIPFFGFYYVASDKSIYESIKIVFPSFVLSTVAIVFSLIYRGTLDQSKEICLSIVEMGISNNICDGSINALAGFVTDFNYGYPKVYGLAALLTFVPVIIYVINNAKKPRIILSTLSLCITATIPLYVVAIDWGRWLSATAILSILALQTTLSSNSNFNYRRAVFSIVLVLSFFYLFNWRLPHCCVGENRFIYSNNVKWWIESFWPSPP